MSRKNNLQRRKTQQSFDQRREEELKAKQEAKRERKAANHTAKQAAAAPPVVTPQAHALSSVASGGVTKAKRLKPNKGFRVKKNGEELAEALRENAACATTAATCVLLMGAMQRRREAHTGDTFMSMASVGLLGYAFGASLLACAALEEDESSSDDD